MLEIHRDTVVGDIVAHDLRTGDVFRGHGIEFCCRGRHTLAQACAGAHVDVDHVLKELQTVVAEPDPAVDLTSLSAARLIDRIVARHHHFVRTYVPAIREYLRKLANRHAEERPETARLAALFDDVGDELLHHLQKEEQVLFPAIERLAAAQGAGPRPYPPEMPLDGPLTVMEDEHEWAAAQLALMRTLAHDYTVPADGDATWRACYEALDRFEEDLREHVSLENNVLFPLARRLTGALPQGA